MGGFFDCLLTGMVWWYGKVVWAESPLRDRLSPSPSGLQASLCGAHSQSAAARGCSRTVLSTVSTARRSRSPFCVVCEFAYISASIGSHVLGSLPPHMPAPKAVRISSSPQGPIPLTYTHHDRVEAPILIACARAPGAGVLSL